MKAIYRLIFKDDLARSTACAYSIAISFLSGLILNLGFGVGLEVAGQMVTLIGLLAFFICILVYSVNSGAIKQFSWDQLTKERLSIRNMSWALGSGVIFLAFVLVSTALEAAMVEKQLRSIVTSKLDVKSAEKTSEVLSKAERMHIQVSSNLMASLNRHILGKIEASPNPAIWQSVNQLLSYQTSLNSSAPESTTFAGFEVAATARSEDHGKWITVPSEKGLAFVGITAILDGRPGAIGTVIEGYNGVFSASIYHNVVFRDCLIRYRGGHLTLSNVFFERCRFEVSPNANGKRFAQAVLGNSVTNLEIQGVPGA